MNPQASPTLSPEEAPPPHQPKRKRGAPRGNKNAVKHGLHAAPAVPPATIADAIDHLAQALANLNAYMTAVHIPALTTDEVIRLSGVYGVNLSRFVRMLRDTAGAKGTDTDQLAAAIDEALTLAAAKLGADLKPS